MFSAFIEAIRDHSNEFYLAHGKHHHAQKQPSVAPALDVCLAIGSSIIANWKFNDPEVQFCRSEKQVKITERIKITEIRSLSDDLIVVLFEKDFCSAQRIFDFLS